MNKLNLSDVAKAARTAISHRSPEILTGIGIAGMITTTIMAVQATPKALERIEDRKIELENELEHDIESLPTVEVIKTAWKSYIPAAIAGTLSIACLIGAMIVVVIIPAIPIPVRISGLRCDIAVRAALATSDKFNLFMGYSPFKYQLIFFIPSHETCREYPRRYLVQLKTLS